MGKPLHREKLLIFGIALIVIIGLAIIMISEPKQAKFWGLIMVSIIGALTILVNFIFQRRRESDVFGKRSFLSDQIIYDNYYATSGLSAPIVTELWHEVAEKCGISFGKLRPTDRFGEEIGSYLITSEKLDSLGLVAMERSRKLKMEIDLSTIKTVDDYIKSFSGSPKGEEIS